MEEDRLLIDERFFSTAKNLISAAKKSIDITTYKAEISNKPRGRKLREFFEMLFAKRREGVSVRFILSKVDNEKSTPVTNVWARMMLKRNLIGVRHLPDNRCCHAKIIIVDGQWAIIGSHNLSIKSCHNNFEVSCMFYNPHIVDHLVSLFDKTWDVAVP